MIKKLALLSIELFSSLLSNLSWRLDFRPFFFVGALEVEILLPLLVTDDFLLFEAEVRAFFDDDKSDSCCCLCFSRSFTQAFNASLLLLDSLEFVLPVSEGVDDVVFLGQGNAS